MKSDLRVVFRGVRGSYPVPGSSTVRVGGNTSCIQVVAGDHLIVIDAGTGIIPLGGELMKAHSQSIGGMRHESIVVTILFTHTHHDHTQGLPFFTPAYLPSTVIYMFGPKTSREDLQDVLAGAMIAPVFPIALEEMAALKRFAHIAEGYVIILPPNSRQPELRHRHDNSDDPPPGSVRITPMKSYAHPKGGVTVYKIEYAGKTLVHATDVEGYVGGDVRLARFAKGADLLIHDAQYTVDEYNDPRSPRQGWGHSTPQMAVDVARAAGVKRLALFHHDPEHDDETMAGIERSARELFPDCFVAAEGMEIEL